ncbi:NAD-dependent epimerase/dehydratase family protein [Psychrobacillus vulpis]|uniref:NAD-dependent epimerase/dehydratase family protein n=1 Tax=Psychrobacillus vulpis TaxID=2325572 RepID=A0A544TUR2_9BACI|nr:NAD-dependent epimerase/dehydratase family protein [Psychrobacillus vulpis]TQR21202.1 NAD-dependent epimerase/dehydratase family protein [Psychrobacillus vulpis]
MRVLITGGYGFIGSHIADRYYKEGYEVFIIDNFSTGKKENISFKHKNYKLSVEDPKCEEIFKSYHFDVVVHLAAQVSVAKSIVNPREDIEANVVGLVNIITLSQKYQVKKFIFASSAAVYGVNEVIPLKEDEIIKPISPYGISKWIGEEYCNKWKEIHDFESVCFRFSNVYGPRQNNDGEGGVISIFLDRIINNEPIDLFGDGEQTRDFIYVEDVADAIFRASNSNIEGIYNLSTNTEYSINHVIDKMKNIHGDIQTNYKSGRVGDIYKSVLSNQKVKDELDWSPMYDLDEGLERTYNWTITNQASKESAVTITPSKSKTTVIYKKIQPYIENLLVFSFISWLILTNQVSMLDTIDVGIFYIMIIGVIYGNRQSIIAVGLSVWLLVAEKLFEGREIISLLYDTTFFFQIALFLFVGLVVGYSIQRKNNMLKEQKIKIEELDKRYDFLNGVYAEVREVKEELQLRMLNSGDSFGKIHSILKELEGLEPEKVFTSTVNVVQTIMNVKNVSIYILNKNNSFLRLIANSNKPDMSSINSLKVDEVKYVQNILKDGKVFVNKQLLSDIPLMAAPIYHDNKVAAIITINDLDFEKFSLYHENLFKVTADLVESALGRAFSYIEATEMNRYIPNTNILKYSVFEEILSSKKEAKEMHKTPFLLLEGLFEGKSIAEYSRVISGLLRETDYIGQSKKDNILVLLSNTTRNDGEVVLSRFKEKGINFKLLEGEI